MQSYLVIWDPGDGEREVARVFSGEEAVRRASARPWDFLGIVRCEGLRTLGEDLRGEDRCAPVALMDLREIA